MEMRKSRVLDRMRSGGVASCVKLNLSDPRVAEIAGLAGFDCVWVDREHVPTDWSTIENVVRSAKAHDMDTMVRVSKGSYSDLVRPLEADAAGIMVPHIMSLAEAKSIVRQTRFHPIGRRPLDGGNADGSYCLVGLEDYLRQANERRFVCVQIEDPEPMAELERIADLDGIDMLFFGPGDFSQGIGRPGKWDDPELLDAQRRVAEACVKHGTFAGTVGGPGNFRQLVDMGYRFISVGADVVALGEYFQKLAELYDR
jgi:2,4-dihydroxyhept-2-ene-1,7-dioic acid aldolase